MCVYVYVAAFVHNTTSKYSNKRPKYKVCFDIFQRLCEFGTICSNVIIFRKSILLDF